jgi:hypothetical protein
VFFLVSVLGAVVALVSVLGAVVALVSLTGAFLTSVVAFLVSVVLG